jgi:TolB-like protein
MRSFLFFPFLFVSVTSFSQKTKDQTVIINELAATISNASFSKIPARLAIVTFVPVQGNANNVNAYGDYLTESIIGKLSENKEKLKLYERKRLDAILKENELMLSGMMKPSEALKIGELLPIDVLFSGTYTKLKSYIDISGRLIDVTSGEIIVSYSGRIKLSKNLKTLFQDEETTTTVVPVVQPTTVIINNQINNSSGSTPSQNKVDMEAICKQKTDKFTEKLQDLSTPEKVNALVAEAMKTPFENRCGKLHYYLIDALARYKIVNENYKRFLIATLDTIAYPSGDDRAYSILSYFTKDGTADEAEWNAGLNVAKKVGDYSLSTYLSFLYNRVTQPELEQLQKRADVYFQHLNKNQIGLPRPIDYNKGFFEMMEALNANQPLRVYVYENYSSKVSTESDNVVSSHFVYLKKMYEDEIDAATKTKIANWFADYINNHPYKKSPDQLYEFANQFVIESNPDKNHYIAERNAERLVKFPVSDLYAIINKCSDKFSQYALQSPYTSQKEDRINFCVQHSIPVAGVIPTIEEAETILKSNDLDEELRIVKLLIQMDPKKLKPLEGTLIALLNKKSLEDKEKLTEIQSIGIQILGRLHTTEPKAIQYMIEKLPSYNYKESDSAKEALVNIGKPAVPVLINKLNSTTNQDGGLQYQLVVILGKIGKDAKAAENALKQMLAKTSNSDVRYAIEATLQAIAE